MDSPRFRSVLLIVWVTVVAGGFVWLTLYKATPGRAGNPAVEWTGSDRREQGAGGATLWMFAHPRCPCTRASLRELEQLLAGRPKFDRVRVVFYRPSDAGPEWLESDVVRQAQSLGGVEVSWDPEGRQAQQFGAETSGQVLVYDASGRLTFSGGITPSRGHEGWNAGLAAVSALGRGDAAVGETPVFGCSLRGLAVSSARQSKAQEE